MTDLTVRIGTREREAAQAALAAHLAAGRIDLDEYTERTDACLAARTGGDLAALFADLPESSPPAAARNDSLDLLLGLTVLFGYPTAAVLGFAAHAWWAFGVVTAVAFVLATVEALLNGHRQKMARRGCRDLPGSCDPSG